MTATSTTPPAAPKPPTTEWVNGEAEVLVAAGNDLARYRPELADKSREITNRIAGNYRALAAERDRLRGLLERAQYFVTLAGKPVGGKDWSDLQKLNNDIKAALAADAVEKDGGGHA